jgi:hypothetical protein
MATDITVTLTHRPGTLAQLGEVLGKVGVNIEGACGFLCEGRDVVHILIKDEDVPAVWRALQQAGLRGQGARQVLVVEIEDQPGKLGSLVRRFADADINIDLVYLTTQGQVVLGVDDMTKARDTLAAG